MAPLWDGNWDSGAINAQGLPEYDASAPVDSPHQTMELVVVCLADALAFSIIAARTYMRKRKLKHLRADDWWMIAAGLLLLCVWWPSQIAANRFGSGLHWKNMTEVNKKKFWISTWGFSMYYIISSIIKVSICYCHLGLIPDNFVRFRRAIKGLCVFIMTLGVTEAALWNFNCQPILSNFVWEVPGETCIDLDGPRYIWVALSVIIDLVILAIPFRILRQTQLAQAEKRALMFVFACNLLGTLVCLVGIYGIYVDRWDSYVDGVFSETNFIIINNLEVLMYTLGASFPVLAPYLVSRVATAARFPISSWLPAPLRKRFSNASYSTNGSTKSVTKETIFDQDHHPTSRPNSWADEQGRGWEEVGLSDKPDTDVLSAPNLPPSPAPREHTVPIVTITPVADPEKQAYP